MTRWIKNRLTNIFTPKARAAAPSNRFRPSMISLEDRTVPAGADMFADATVLTETFDGDTDNNAAATGEVDEPNHATMGGLGLEQNSLWWQWTAPESGTVDINTFGSGFDTVLGVYTGSAVNLLAEVASNDDANSSQSQVLFAAVGGTTYFIAVDGFGSATGNVVLHLGMTQPNDDFANATIVDNTTMFGSNGASTAEAGEPLHSTFNPEPNNSVWWSWTPAASGSAEINTFGSDFDTALAVYTGTAVNDLDLVVANDDAGGLQSQVFFNAVGGTTYYIAVDGFLNETGSITLNVPTAQAPTNDPPVIGAQTFSVDENSIAGTVIGTVAASDPNGHSLMYAITAGNESGTFFINPTTGQLQVADDSALNHEVNPSFVLTVQVTDNGSPNLSTDASVTINVNDVNEAPTVGPAGPFLIAENSANGTAVGSVPSADPDAGDTRTYSIVGGDGTFAIDNNGQITVANSAALDFETTQTFNITVQVTDAGNLSATTSVTINLSDVNEQTPAQQYVDLNNMVIALRTSGDLTNPQANKLLKNLESSERQFNKGNLTQAENDLMMFINQLNTYVNSGILTGPEAQPLIDAAQILIDTI